MNATEKNEKTARTIVNVLAENECTVQEASEILRYVDRFIFNTATVKKTEEQLFKLD